MMTLLPILLAPSKTNSVLVHSKNARQASSTVKSAIVNSPVSRLTTPLPKAPSQKQISQYN